MHIAVAGSNAHWGVCRYCDVDILAQDIVCVEFSFMHVVREMSVVYQC